MPYADKNTKREYDKAYRLRNLGRKLEQGRLYRAANRDKLVAYSRIYYLANKDALLTKQREYYRCNQVLIRAKHLEYYRQTRAERCAYQTEKRRTDTIHKLKNNLRCRLNVAIRSCYHVGSAVRGLGCSIAMFKLYMESQFLLGMTWENWGRKGWHIDHIVPLSTFDLTDPTEFREACHYTNLIPMWATDNLSKGNRS